MLDDEDYETLLESDTLRWPVGISRNGSRSAYRSSGVREYLPDRHLYSIPEGPYVSMIPQINVNVKHSFEV